MSKKKVEEKADDRVRAAPPEPMPAPPQPLDLDTVKKAIAEVQADPDFRHYSVEHLEVAAIRRLIEQGCEAEAARAAVQERLYNP